MRVKKKSRIKGFVTAVCLFVLVIVSVLMVSIGSVGTMNLDIQQSYRVSSVAQYAARAAVGEALADISTNKSFGATTISVSVPLDNSTLGSTNFLNPASLPCSPCPAYYSVNNLTGSSNTTVADGFGFPVPGGYVKINGVATYLGKTAIFSVLAGEIPYGILAEGTITATTVTGGLRNNVTSGSPSITVTSATLAMTPDTTPGSVAGTIPDVVYGAPPITIPDIPVANIVASESAAGCSVCLTPHQYGGPAAQQFPNQSAFMTWLNAPPRLGVLDASKPSCQCSNGIYIGGDITLTGKQSVNLRNGVQLFINGNFTQQGGPQFFSSGSPSNQVMVAGNFTMNGANLSSLLLVAGGNIQFNGDSTISGFVYSENGNITGNGPGSSWTGSVVARAGTVSISSLTYNPSYVGAFASFYSLPLTVTSSWIQ